MVPDIAKTVRFLRWAIFAAAALVVSMMTVMAAPKLSSGDEGFEVLSFIVPVMLWNLAPLAIGYFLLKGAETRSGWASVAFAICVSGTTFYIFGGYILMALGVYRGSSTEVLGLLFLPAYQLILAGVVGVFVFVVTFLKERFLESK